MNVKIVAEQTVVEKSARIITANPRLFLFVSQTIKIIITTLIYWNETFSSLFCYKQVLLANMFCLKVRNMYVTEIYT